VVARVRRVLRERSVGHTGSLDPAATGVLALVLGRATRLARFLSASDKAYDAVVRLGFATDTADASGVPLGDRTVGDRPPDIGDQETAPRPSRDEIERVLDEFRGTYLQQPPAYSAKKIGGTRSYQLARSKKSDQVAAVLPSPVTVAVHRLEIVDIEADRVTLRVECSAGFYVRSLAHDLGTRLGIGAHLTALRRMRSGECRLSDAIALETLEREPERAHEHVIPMAGMLRGFPPVVLTPEGVRRAGHGRDLGAGELEAPSETSVGSAPESRIPNRQSRGFVRLLAPDGDLIGIATPTASGLLHPSVVLV